MAAKGCSQESKNKWKQWCQKGSWEMPKWELDEDIVISGISGRFPESENIEELKTNLFEGIDMITENDRRWEPGFFDTPRRMGKLKEISHFDSMFFGVHGKMADVMDPQQRILLEATYEAVFDAGYDPASLRGKNIGVFIGCSERCAFETFRTDTKPTGYELLGLNLGMMANRISYTFDFTGPSFILDTACSASFHALNEAALALRNNRCEAAIVGGATISVNILLAHTFGKLGLTSKGGMCKVFDATADGYVRSEGVSVLFLQRASEARRCYATVLHCKLNNDGAKPEGITFPRAEIQKQLYHEIYSELNMDPTEIAFLEAHGTGTVAGDREETNAIADFFLQGREDPLIVGSVKSNLGHAEAASGMESLAKVILSMEEGKIAPNLHYKEPNPQVPALVEGNLRVITEAETWTPGIVAINNFGFGGSNAHAVLMANKKEKQEQKKRDIPRLAFSCGRNEAAVQYIFNKMKEEKFTDDTIALLEEASKAPTSGMQYRGYALVGNPEDELVTVIEKSPTDKRQVWFLFSGMGSQWAGMAKDMMKIKIFANSIKQSAEILKPYGVDLVYLLTEATEIELNQIVAPFVTIAAVQIALVDIIKNLGIEPDGIVGHSVGELGCAYADGCFTAEQMLKTAYWRGKSCEETPLIKGAMAAIGLPWEETKSRCPEGVFPVCHNAEDSVTISGPFDLVHDFVKTLNDEKVFARAVKTCDIAFHSQYVEPASHMMRRELEKVIPNPLPRTARWVSSSVPEENWTEPLAQTSSVDYHVNNLLSPVLFNEAMSKVPNNAIVIEFAPHSFLHAIVKRILGSEAIYVGFMKRNEENNINFMLNSIGKLYTSNLNPKVCNLYDAVQYPVPRGTPRFSSLIQWNHGTTWSVNDFHSSIKRRDVFTQDTLKGSTEEYLLGHKVDGRVLFPAMGYMCLIWEVYSIRYFKNTTDSPVIFEDIGFLRATLLPRNGVYRLTVKILESSGEFQVLEGGSTVVTGRIRFPESKCLKNNEEDLKVPEEFVKEHTFTLNANDFYKELRLRGYEYGPTFKGVLEAESSGLRGRVKWEGRWVTFMDAMLQIPILLLPKRALLLPTRIKSLRIDPGLLPENGDEGIPYVMNPHINVCKCGPVEIQGLHCGVAPKRMDMRNEPVLEEHIFVPFFDFNTLSEEEINHVEEYSHVCSSLAHRILTESRKNKEEISAVLNGFKEAPEEQVQKYLESKEKNYVLLRVLKKVLYPESEKNEKEKENDDPKCCGKTDDKSEGNYFGIIEEPEKKGTKSLTTDTPNANLNKNDEKASNINDKVNEEIVKVGNGPLQVKDKVVTQNDKNKSILDDIKNVSKEENNKNALRNKICKDASKEDTSKGESQEETKPEEVDLRTLSFDERLKYVLDKDTIEMHSDLLTTISLNEHSLRAALDVVQDNLLSGKITILEVSSHSIIHKDVTRMLGMSTLGLVRFEYTVARIGTEAVPEGLLDSSVKSIQWDCEAALPSGNDLVVAKDLFTDSGRAVVQTLEAISSALRDNGFILLVERTNISSAERFIATLTDKTRKEQSESSLENAFTKLGLALIAKKKDQVTSVTYLLRKLEKNSEKRFMEPDVLVIQEDDDHSWVETLKEKLKAVADKTDVPRIWLVAEKPTSGILGLYNCLRLENGGKHLRIFFNSELEICSSEVQFDPTSSKIKWLLRTDLSINMQRNGCWGRMSHRIIDNNPKLQLREHGFMNVMNRGDLSTIKWVESELKDFSVLPKTKDQALVHVYYAPLNFRDIMLASGRLPPDAIPSSVALLECILGLEFSGRDETGKRVMGIRVAQALATTVSIPPKLLFDVPDDWTLEEASTVPVVYLTAFYALITRGKIKKGESVLIHSGSGGVGQAAIRLALNEGCEVFVTVGNEEKKKFLQELHPELDDKHFSTSRDDRFEYDIMNATNGKGVDVVLNSLAEEKLQASIRCLKKHGRFLEIGKFDLAMNNKLGLAALQKNISVHGVLLDALFDDYMTVETEMQECLQQIKEGIKNGVVKPINSNIFNWDQGEEAFRFMASGKHMGKVVIKIRDEETEKIVIPSSIQVPCIPRTYCHPHKSAIVTGGLGGFGLELAHWLIERGVRNLVLSSRTDVKNGYQQIWFQRWREQGIQIKVSNKDITSREGVESLIQEATDMGSVEGIFHLALVLHDGMFENLKEEDYNEVWKPKAMAARLLDEASRKMCPDLRYFVVFSSIVAGRGNPGQSNYGYANSYMERIVERRKIDGLPGLAFQWGGMGDVGVVYEHMGGNDVVLKGSIPQRLGSCLAVLDRFMQEDYTIVSSFVPVQKGAFGFASEKDLIEMLCNVLGIKDPSSVKPEMTLGELGMDSLMGVEIKQVLETEYDTVLTVPEVRQLSINDLKAIGEKKKQGQMMGDVKESDSSVPSMVSDFIVPKDVLVPLNNVQSTHCVFMVHSVEGHTGILKELGSRIQKRAFGLQFTKDVPHGTIQEMAACYVEKMKEVQPHGPYNICGYSIGCLIAFEMALLLQKTDQVKSLICMDDTPSTIADRAKTWLCSSQDSRRLAQAPFELVVETYFKNVSEEIRTVIKNNIMDSTLPYEKNVEYFMKIMQVSVPQGNVETMLNQTTRLAKASSNYQSSGLYRGKATLIKSTETRKLNDENLGNLHDYGFKKFVDGPVEVLEMTCNHRDIVQDKAEATALIINSRIQD